MSYRLGGRNPLAYMGVEPSQPPQMLIETRSPTINDNQYNLGTYWFIAAPPPTTNWELWILADLTAGIATWLQLYPSGSPGVDRFDADVGFAVPDLGLINLFGGANINTAGDDMHTLTVNLNETIHWPATSSDGLAGAIYLNGSNGSGGSLFMHDYGTDNTWLGINAGNLTLTVLSATANTGIGQEALTALTTGSANTAIGSLSQTSVTTGNINTSLGAGSLISLVSGTNNIAIGQAAGSSYTTSESNNIIIGNDGVIGESDTIRIGIEGTQTAAYMAGIYDEPIGMPNAVVYVDSTGKLATGSPIPPPPLPGGIIITIFDTSGTFVINPQTKVVESFMWSGGSGGGSGYVGIAPNMSGVNYGGNGGGAANCMYNKALAIFFNPVGETVTIGVGGTGGAAVPSASTNTIGNDGAPGGASAFGNYVLPVGGYNSGFLYGKGGRPSPGQGGTNYPIIVYAQALVNLCAKAGPGSNGGGGGVSPNGPPFLFPVPGGGINSLACYASYISPTGGGGGSGNNTSTPPTGGAGGAIKSIDTSVTFALGGAGGGADTDGSNGNPATMSGGILTGGTGGGGGGQYSSSKAGSGGNGGFPGGGGGGGAAGVNTVADSGAGGNGGNGRLIVIEYL